LLRVGGSIPGAEMSASTSESQPPRPSLRRVILDPSDYLDDLLMYIRAGRVIPIVGPELLSVQVNGREVLLHQYVAERLAEQFKLTSDLPEPYTLQQVVALYKQSGQAIERVYVRVCAILSEQELRPSSSLLKLARIADFRLFVTTSFDSLLTHAINQERFQGAPRTQEIIYAPSAPPIQLEPGWERSATPIVIHLFGKASCTANSYVVTDEDMLEFLYALQSEAKRPDQRLFDELQSNHLLFIGCSFPDWLARLFIRLAKREKLSRQRSEIEVLADSRTSADSNLAMFLDNFSYSTRVFPGNAIEFVDLLSDRWESRFGRGNAQAAVPDAASSAQADRMPAGAVFISYANENRRAAEQLHAGLSDVADVWLDSRDLAAADDYDLKIRRNVSQCSLFIPVISRQAIERQEGYFRREWYQARDRLKSLADGVPFIVPVVVDDTPVNAFGVPEEFWRFQATRLPDGVVTPEFVNQLVRLIRRLRSANPIAV
jgi:hypothetical protein